MQEFLSSFLFCCYISWLTLVVYVLNITLLSFMIHFEALVWWNAFIWLYVLLHLTAFFQDNLDKLAPERQNHSGFCWSKEWHQLDHMQIIFSILQTDNHAST